MSLTQNVPVNKNFEKLIAIILRTGLVKAMVKLNYLTSLFWTGHDYHNYKQKKLQLLSYIKCEMTQMATDSDITTSTSHPKQFIGLL